MLQQIGARAVTGVDVGGKVGHAPWTPERTLRVGTLGMYLKKRLSD